MDHRAIQRLGKNRAAVGDELHQAARTIRASVVANTSRSVMGQQRPATTPGLDEDSKSVYAQVAIGDPGWHLLEYGTADLAPTRQIMHAVQATGVRFVDGED